ncbi:MAG: hypothetical protein V1744_03650 [Candidatus Altiarchaeota archaeon]
MRPYFAVWVVLLLAGYAIAEDSCKVEVLDDAKGMHAVVEACDNIGTYSLGGLYDGQWTKLTFQYPEPWAGTFTTFDIDGEYFCTSKDGRNCTIMDGYVSEKPKADGAEVATSWNLPRVSVTQSLNIIENRTLIRYSVHNTDAESHKVGIRLHLDTMLGVNDGAPIYVPGDGLKTEEVEYSGAGLNFGYWKVYNTPDNPTIVATGTIDPNDGMTYPTRVVVADWKRSKDTAWDYNVEGRPITGDSAVILYFDLGVIDAGGEAAFETGIGSDAPVLSEEQGTLGLTEIVLSNISGVYCPGDDVTLKVDVLSAGVPRSGSVALNVEKDGKVYYSNTQNAALPKDTIVSLVYNWKIQDDKEGGYTVKAWLYNDTGVVDYKEKPNAVIVSETQCVNRVLEVGGGIVGGFLFIAVIVSIGLAMAAGFYLWFNRGSVEFTKYVDGEYVKVTVLNNTQKTIHDIVIEDTIPPEVELKVRTLNVIRRQNMLEWSIGKLRPKESATLDYYVKGGRAVSSSSVRWDRGGKSLA